MCIKFDFNTLLLFYCLSVIAVGSYAEEVIKKWERKKEGKQQQQKGGGGGGECERIIHPYPFLVPSPLHEKQLTTTALYK